MNVSRVLVMLLLAALVGSSACGRRAGQGPDAGPEAGPTAELPPPGTPIDPDTVAAWKEAGIVLESPGSVEKGEIPWLKLTRNITIDTLNRLPKPTVLFGLSLGTNFYPTAAGLKHLTDIETLARIHILNTLISDEYLAHFAQVGFHRLYAARGADGKRPTTPDEVTEVDLGLSGVTDNGLRHLAGLKNLTSLNLSGYAGSGKVTDAGLEHLAALPSLAKLDLAGSGVTDAGLKRLADFPSLTSLKLTDTRITNAGVQHLAGLKNLKELSLSPRDWNPRTGGALTGRCLEHIAGLTNLTSLHLALSGPISDEQVQSLAGLTNLTTLSLSETEVKSSQLKHLASLKKLQTLSLKKEQFNLGVLAQADLLHAVPQATGPGGKRPANADEVVHLDFREVSVYGGWEYLAAYKNLETIDGTISVQGRKRLEDHPKLRVENLWIPVGAEVPPDLAELRKPFRVRVIGNFPDTELKRIVALPNLTGLELWTVYVTDDGLKHLASAKNLTALALELRFDRPSEAGMQHLASLTNLTSLHVRAHPVSDAGLKHIAGLHKLTSLSLDMPEVTDEGLKNLAALKNLQSLTLKVPGKGSGVWAKGGRWTAAGIAELQKALPNCKITQQ